MERIFNRRLFFHCFILIVVGFVHFFAVVGRYTEISTYFFGFLSLPKLKICHCVNDRGLFQS